LLFFQLFSTFVGLNYYGIGQGLMVFDYDKDGDLHFLVVNQKPILDYPVESVTHLYRNDSPKSNLLKIALKGI
jgi:enediyne biosynthesis protein E4